ncbi:MAG: DUF2513 domain-containing protein [Clostridia bacterium]|nr:DUF2513 domain-containing protein [Clostridia bacterium]MDD4375803.1 DUF2513 domain-containing protein [Clostridia bacterium]
MKRNMDLIRELLFYIEENYDGNLLIIDSLENYSNSELLYHFELMIQANLVTGKTTKYISGEGIIECKGLSWAGQDFLANIKNENVWTDVKKTAKEKGLDLTISIISSIASESIKKILGL